MYAMLSSIESTALRAQVGLKVNRLKTEFLLVGTWNTLVTLCLSSGSIKQVDDFKYLEYKGGRRGNSSFLEGIRGITS